jgi:hypothetical protein
MMELKDLDVYLADLETSQTIKERIIQIVNFYNDQKLIAVDHVFVSQEIIEEKLTHTALWVFDNLGNCGEADLTGSNFSLDIAPFKNKVKRYAIIANSLEFTSKDKNNFLNIQTLIIDGLACNLKAYGANMAHLWDIFSSLIKPNYVDQPITPPAQS